MKTVIEKSRLKLWEAKTVTGKTCPSFWEQKTVTVLNQKIAGDKKRTSGSHKNFPGTVSRSPF